MEHTHGQHYGKSHWASTSFIKKKRSYAIHFGSCQYHSWDPDCKLLLSFLPSLAISPSHTVKWSRVQNFSPQSSGNRMFFPDIQSYCMAGISLQDFFVLKIRLQDIFFWNHLIPPPPPPPPPQKSNSRPLISSLHMIGHISVLHNHCETH